jgi:very-short-patch-repair endonuclease
MKDAEQRLIEMAVNGVVTSGMVERAGLTRWQWERLRRNDTWVPVVPGQFRHAATQLDWRAHVKAVADWLGGDCAASGWTAARLWGLDGAARRDDVEFLVPRSRRHVPAWIELHTTLLWDRQDLLTVDSIRTCSCARVIIDLAARGTPARQLEALIDSAVRLRRTSIATLIRRAAEISERRPAGSARLRELMMDSGGESLLERRFLRLVRLAGLPRPTCQRRYDRERGRTMRVDFDFDPIPLVVEVSGRVGHASDRDRQREARRRNALAAIGPQVIEFVTADVVDDPDYVIDTLRSALRRHPPTEDSPVGA